MVAGKHLRWWSKGTWLIGFLLVARAAVSLCVGDIQCQATYDHVKTSTWFLNFPWVGCLSAHQYLIPVVTCPEELGVGLKRMVGVG